ncbi:MAG: hypothetical protein A3E78_14215 [Alphaproteobacteria bacterium RIFCSPHIGHO2_12_FULL_63_12]|nr:MAG: hypothetical protein A3E78_14215 [Alphaproteobacteria bacterium RIFCSPHIGHO2_12_FULL_63_12]
MSLSGLMDRRAAITRRTATPDGKGGHTYSTATVTNTPARVRPATAREAIRSDRPETVVSHVLYVGPAVDILPRDRVTIDGTTYEVVGVRPPSKRTHLEVDLVERQRGAV